MLTVKEKCPCGSGDGCKGRSHVYYLCQCGCGKEAIFFGRKTTHVILKAYFVCLQEKLGTPRAFHYPPLFQRKGL